MVIMNDGRGAGARVLELSRSEVEAGLRAAFELGHEAGVRRAAIDGGGARSSASVPSEDGWSAFDALRSLGDRLVGAVEGGSRLELTESSLRIGVSLAWDRGYALATTAGARSYGSASELSRESARAQLRSWSTAPTGR